MWDEPPETFQTTPTDRRIEQQHSPIDGQSGEAAAGKLGRRAPAAAPLLPLAGAQHDGHVSNPDDGRVPLRRRKRKRGGGVGWLAVLTGCPPSWLWSLACACWVYVDAVPCFVSANLGLVAAAIHCHLRVVCRCVFCNRRDGKWPSERSPPLFASRELVLACLLVHTHPHRLSQQAADVLASLSQPQSWAVGSIALIRLSLCSTTNRPRHFTRDHHLNHNNKGSPTPGLQSSTPKPWQPPGRPSSSRPSSSSSSP
jgi:hypothetical protein